MVHFHGKYKSVDNQKGRQLLHLKLILRYLKIVLMFTIMFIYI